MATFLFRCRLVNYGNYVNCQALIWAGMDYTQTVMSLEAAHQFKRIDIYLSVIIYFAIKVSSLQFVSKLHK